jgi:hypothetical protein
MAGAITIVFMPAVTFQIGSIIEHNLDWTALFATTTSPWMW